MDNMSNASVMCVIVKDNEVGHEGPFYVHTVHLRHSFNYFLTKNANQYKKTQRVH